MHVCMCMRALCVCCQVKADPVAALPVGIAGSRLLLLTTGLPSHTEVPTPSRETTPRSSMAAAVHAHFSTASTIHTASDQHSQHCTEHLRLPEGGS